ncbi:MAG: N-acetylmuramoyl-L-alanine amidase [Bacteroidetes bacterium]|nr:N-acetylmuramoyl-L-alanine amidase [Bacteroidota bacterium]
MKNIVLVPFLAAIILLNSFSTVGVRDIKIKKVVIDAGHGGKDSGTSGAFSIEKDIALKIARKAGEYIDKNLKGVEVIYTRFDDKFVELEERAQIANRNGADLFISIHCNSFPSPTVYGTETYVMGVGKTAANLAVAKRENAAILMEENYEARYDGYDPNSPEANIIFSLYQNAYLEQSLELASKIQNQFQQGAGRRSRGVKQAGFLVLYKTTMPSILIEAGFLTHAKEAKFLSSDKGQDYIADAIFKAFKEYKLEVEGVVPEDYTDQTDETHAKENQDIVFKVQIITSSKPIPLDSPNFEGIKDVKEYISGGWYKYTAGEERDLKSVYSLQEDIRKKGFKSAFVVAFNNDKRISLQKAIKLLE